LNAHTSRAKPLLFSLQTLSNQLRMPKTTYTLTLLTLLFFSGNVNSAGQQTANEAIYLEPGWLALLHYHPASGQKNSWISEADDSRFFISKIGKTSPQDEMQATLDALNNEQLKDDALCRFPARYKWLGRRLNFIPPLPKHCPELEKWRKQFSAKSLAIMFASAYLESPASVFGHTFLRFRHSGPNEIDRNLFTETINYAADAADQNGIISFIYQGLSGGYAGVADTVPLFKRLRIYSDNEGRDIWEYTLDFSEDEIELISLHIWEIKNLTFDYFFIDENCAYRTLSILSVARPKLKLTEGYTKYAIPVDTIRTLANHNLIRNINYWPSANKLLLAHASKLTQPERILARDIATGKVPAHALTMTGIDLPKKALILSVAFDYLSILIARDEIEDELSDQQTKILIAARAALGHNPEYPVASSASSPEHGHKTGRSSVMIGRLESDDYIQIGLRGVYHDFIDSLTGYDEGLEIDFLSIDYMFLKNGSRTLRQLDLINISSRIRVNEFFSPPAWSFNVGRLRKPIEGEFRSVNTVGYKRGKSHETGLNVLTYLFGVNVDNDGYFDHRFALEALARLEAQKQGRLFSYSLSLERASYLNENNLDRLSTNLTIGWSTSENYRIVLEAKKDRDRIGEIDSIGLGLYSYF
jgi:hypothetical protein